MTLHLKFTALGGEAIEHAAAELQRLADRLNITAELQFNEVKLFAVPGGTAEALVVGYRREIHRTTTHPMAWSHHGPERERA